MAATLAHLYRHPVKSLGEEALEAVTLESGRAMPWDRTWAVAHANSAFDRERPQWVDCRSFVTQTYAPTLAQIGCRFDEASGTLRLSHPGRPPLEVVPESTAGAAALSEWIAPLAPEVRPGPYRLARLPGGAFTDYPDSHLLVCSTATLAAMEELAGHALAHVRFRANLWFDGLAPWAELELAGRALRVGRALIRLTERCERCNAIAADPATGRRDAAGPALLRRRLGHRDFGIYAEVLEGGEIALGDRATLV